MVCEHYKYLLLELKARSEEEQRDFLKQIIEAKIDNAKAEEKENLSLAKKFTFIRKN